MEEADAKEKARWKKTLILKMEFFDNYHDYERTCGSTEPWSSMTFTENWK